jgi:signal transduction histidine kinase
MTSEEGHRAPAGDDREGAATIDAPPASARSAPAVPGVPTAPAGSTPPQGHARRAAARPRHDRQRQDSAERLRLATRAGGVGVWEAELGRRPGRAQVILDERMWALLDLPETEGLDLTALIRAAFPRTEAERFEAELARAADTDGVLSIELERDAADGTDDAPAWLHWAGRVLRDPAGRAERIVGCTWDTSHEREAARALAAKEAAEAESRHKSALLSRMSHELRTPLNAILGFSQLMRMEFERGDLIVKPHRVALIETAARHLLDLVNEVLDVSQMEAGRLAVHLAPTDLRELVHAALPMVLGAAEARAITLDDTLAAGPPCPVLCDRLRTTEVLIHLLTNAVHYHRPQGHVRVSATVVGDRVHLAVADNGPGLSPRQQAGLFEPFDRLGAEASGVPGAGLGLYTSRRFAEMMGGTIEVHSRLGEGTTATLVLNRPG